MGRQRVSAKGAEREPVNTANERTGQKEYPAADYDDYNQQPADDDLHGGDDDLHGSDNELHGSYVHGSNDDDLSDYEGYDDEEDGLPLPSLRITYDGDSPDVEDALLFFSLPGGAVVCAPPLPLHGHLRLLQRSFCLLLLLAERPTGNMIIWAKGAVIEDAFQVRIEIPEDDNKIEVANFIFTVDPYACNKVITRTILTARLRKIDLTFVPLYRAIQANVFVCLDLIAGGGGGSSTGDTVYYVYGEITAHHQHYGDKNVMLFYRVEGNKIKLVDGETAKFWHDAWLFDRSLRISFLDLFAACTKRSLPVKEALADLRWCRHFKRDLSTTAIVQFTDLLEAVQTVHLHEGVRYSLIWKWTSDGVFSVQSAYNIQFEGRTLSNFHLSVWDSDASRKCQFFAWLAVLGRFLTADNLLKRGLPHNPIPESAMDPFLGCSFAHQIWGLVFNRCQFVPRSDMSAAESIADWWVDQVVGMNKDSGRRFNSVTTLVTWELWKECNHRIFNQRSKSDKQPLR
ncbi:hypothetical protein ACQ4PT_025356 [Festuca glaucescens]